MNETIRLFLATVGIALLAGGAGAAPKQRGPIDFDIAARLSVEIDAETAAYCAKKASGIESVGRNDILVLGDSLSDFDRDRNHWAILAKYLNAKRQGAFRIYNYAIAGDFAQRVLDRMDGKGYRRECFRDLWSRPYDWAFVMLGGNDTKAWSDTGYEEVVTPPESEERIYREFISRMKAHGIRRIVLVSCARADWETCQAKAKALDGKKPRHTRFGEPRHMERFNAVLKKLADETDGVEYLDIHTPMQSIGMIADYVREADGVHLVDKGYRFVACRILDYLAATPNDRPVVLSKTGMTIAIPENATPSQRYAAEELRAWTEKLAGVKAEIGSGTEGTVVIRDGDAKTLEDEDSFALKESDGRLVITGGKRGVLYGVYELLERYGGIEFLSSWRTVVPEKGALAVPAGLDQRQTPAFLLRRSSWFDAMRNGDFSARCRQNGWGFGLEERHGGDARIFGAGLEGHSLYRLLPEKNFPTNRFPEYWAKDPIRTTEDVQPCFSNPDVRRIVTSNLLALVRSDPGAPFYSLSQKDGAKNYCRCEKCKAIIEEEGSTAGPVIRFVNAVAAEVGKEFPDARFPTLVYTWTRHPCAKTRMGKNVVPYFCTFEADFSQPIETSPYDENRSIMEDISGWCAQAKDMIIWDYVTDFYNYYFTYPNVRVLRPNLRYFQRCGARYLSREQAAAHGSHADLAELKNWLLSKWMWDPSQPEDELMDRFLRGYYGAAAPFVKEYIDGLHAVPRDAAKNPLRLYESAEFGRVPESFLLKATELWDKALAAVRGDAELEYNVTMGKVPVLYTRLMILRGPHADKGIKADASRDAEAKALATWVWDTLESARYPMRFAEQTKRHSTIRQVIWDLTGRKVPVRGAKLKFTPNRAPYGVKLSKKPDFPANETREWPRKLKAAEVELGDLEPNTVYYWWTDDNMHRHEQGYFMTEGGGSGGALAPARERDEKSPDSDGWIPAN